MKTGGSDCLIVIGQFSFAGSSTTVGNILYYDPSNWEKPWRTFTNYGSTKVKQFKLIHIEIPGFGTGILSDAVVHGTDVYICGFGLFDWNSNIKGYSSIVKCSMDTWDCQVFSDLPFTFCRLIEFDSFGNTIVVDNDNQLFLRSVSEFYWTRISYTYTPFYNALGVNEVYLSSWSGN